MMSFGPSVNTVEPIMKVTVNSAQNLIDCLNSYYMKVLVVDDNEEITEVVCFVLEDMSVSCTVVSDRKQGLDMIKQRDDFDIIFFDILKPLT